MIFIIRAVYGTIYCAYSGVYIVSNLQSGMPRPSPNGNHHHRQQVKTSLDLHHFHHHHTSTPSLSPLRGLFRLLLSLLLSSLLTHLLSRFSTASSSHHRRVTACPLFPAREPLTQNRHGRRSWALFHCVFRAIIFTAYLRRV